MGKRRRTYAKPPEKFHFEKDVRDTDFSDRFYLRNIKNENESGSFKNPLYPVSWGWNDSGRAGNITDDSIYEVKRVQQTHQERIIAAAAGKHHSLIVSEEGNVYTFGDNKHWQLGYGNPFTTLTPQKEPAQYYPRQVTPTGHLRYGRDFKVTEVGGGASYSIAREASSVDAVKFSKGMLALERGLAKLIRLYPDALPLAMADAKLRQEKYMFSRAYGGQVMTWGTGKYGELGLGKHIQCSVIPRVVPSFRSVQITQIASGNQHCLAIDSEGRLYSWGRGSSGQLGHDNGNNYFEPTLIAFFEHYCVEQCAAGRQHSAVLITSRKSSGDRASKLKRLVTFGRGAHGRLGVGHNRSLSKPTMVTVWPPSVRPMSLVQVACGGAHTLVLATKGVTRTLSSPIGVETVVLAFGFGTNGQLGTGYIDNHEFYPVKVKFPRWEIISEISAGKSWSLARTINGDLFGWGKGLRGQLGMQKKFLSVAPRNLNSFASVLKISSGYAHNVCISTPKKYHNSKIVNRDMPDVLSQEAFIFNRSLLQQNRACDLVHLCLSAGNETKVLGTIGCCRIYTNETTLSGRFDIEMRRKRAMDVYKTENWYEKGDAEDNLLKKDNTLDSRIDESRGRISQAKPNKFIPSEDIETELDILPKLPPPDSYVRIHPTMRFMQCLDCNLSCVCLVCIKICHSRHRVCHISGNKVHTVVDDQTLHCHCSALHPKCRVMPFIPEVYEGDDVENDDDYYDLKTQNKLMNFEGVYHPRSLEATEAAKCIQRLARAYFGKLQLAKMRAYVLSVRREACKNFWENEVLGEIWSKLNRTAEIHRDNCELLTMQVEEERGRTYNNYYYLQAGLKGMNLMNLAVDKLIAGCSMYFPNRSDRPDFETEYNHKHLSIEDFEEKMVFDIGLRSRPGSRALKSSERKTRTGAGSRFGKKKAGNTLSKRISSADEKKKTEEKGTLKENDSKANSAPSARPKSPKLPEAFSEDEKLDRGRTPPIGSPKNMKRSAKSGKTVSVRTAIKSDSGPKSTLAISKAALAKPTTAFAPQFGHELFAPPASGKIFTKGHVTDSQVLLDCAFSSNQRDDSQNSRTFCWNSARSLQLRVSISDMRRLLPSELAQASKYFPLYVSPEKERNLLSCDGDIGLHGSRYVSDIYSENKRYSLALQVARRTQQKEIQRLARRRAKVEQQMKAAEAARRAKNAELEREQKEKAGAVKRMTIASSKGMAPLLVAAKNKKEQAMAPNLKLPRLPKLIPLRELPPRRRKSICDPCKMASRLEKAAERAMDLTTGAYGYSLRRPSLPAQLSKLRPRIPLSACDAQTELLLNQSLELFQLRLSMLLDCLVSPLYVFPPDTGKAAAMLRFDPSSPQTNVRKLMEFSFLTPRLPRELNEMLVTDNKRRHTIGEPERLAKQLKSLYQTRSCVATIRHQAKRGRFGGMEASHIPKLPSMPYRRRSFDMGEQKDFDDGITEKLGYKYEPPIKHYTIYDLKKQSKQLDRIVSRSRWNSMGKAQTLAADSVAKVEEVEIVPAFAIVPAEPRDKEIEHWQQYFGDDPEIPYYHCLETGQTTWDQPYGDHVQILTRHENDKGKFFWFNTFTGESHWDED